MKIFLEKLEFLGRHGVYEEERVEGRRFEVDLEVELPDHKSAHTDELEHTVDYRELARLVLDVAGGESCSLIERLAGEMASRIIAEQPSIASVKVTVRKYATGVPGDPAVVGVTLFATRDEV